MPRPMRLCVLGSVDDMMSFTARWSLISLAFSAIVNCSAQEYDTSSTTNDEGDHCEKEDGSARPTPHYRCSVREKDQKPTVPTRRKPCWESGPVMSPSGNTRPRPLGPVMSPSVNTRHRPFCPAMSPSRNTMSPSRNTRVRPFGPVMSPFGTPGLGTTMRGRTHGLSRRVPVAHWRKTARSCFCLLYTSPSPRD